MLFPRFTILSILKMMGIVAAAAFVGGYAVRGNAWAIGMSVALICLLATFVIFALMFLLAALLGSLGKAMRPASASPFGSGANSSGQWPSSPAPTPTPFANTADRRENGTAPEDT